LDGCIDSTIVSSVGKYVDKFESDIAGFTSTKKSIACINGINALHLALLLAGVQQNDEVITQPLTFIASANAIRYYSAYPVFVDVEKDTLNMHRFQNPGNINNELENFDEQIDYFEHTIRSMLEGKSWSKQEIVDLFHYMLPDFDHKETGKYLDAKM